MMNAGTQESESRSQEPESRIKNHGSRTTNPPFLGRTRAGVMLVLWALGQLLLVGLLICIPALLVFALGAFCAAVRWLFLAGYQLI